MKSEGLHAALVVAGCATAAVGGETSRAEGEDDSCCCRFDMDRTLEIELDRRRRSFWTLTHSRSTGALPSLSSVVSKCPSSDCFKFRD